MAKIIKRKAETKVEIDLSKMIEQSFSGVEIINREISSNGNIIVNFTHDVEIDTNI